MLVLLVLLVVALLMVVSRYYTEPMYKFHLSWHYRGEFHCIRNIHKASQSYICSTFVQQERGLSGTTPPLCGLLIFMRLPNCENERDIPL